MTIHCPNCKGGNLEKRGYSEGEVPKQRFVCRDCGRWFRMEMTYLNEPDWHRSKTELKKLLDHDRYIITSAQNNTPVDKVFWRALQQLADYYRALIIVIPVLYRNPTNLQDLENEDAWWPQEVSPYLVGNRLQLCPGLCLLGDIRVQATATNPLVGLEALSQGDSAIIGHAQIQMRTIATPQHALPKILHTTGSVSVKNYSNTKAGIKGAFHHSLGALVVERDGNIFHLRSVVGDEKSEFYDLNLHATAGKVKKISHIEALVTGDSHAVFHCPKVRKATFDDKKSIVRTLNPKRIVRHDLVDSYSISHWHRGHPVTNFKKWLRGTNSLQKELEATARFVEETTPKGTLNVIVASNHHEHIARWLEEADPKQEPWNAVIYHELMLAWLNAVQDGKDHFDPFAHWMTEHCQAECKFVGRDEPYVVEDILVSMHGDKGPNGSRGSLVGLSRMGVKTVVGHTHAPAIEKGCYMVGTSSVLNLEYSAGGPSSWLNTHAIIHPNGKRQLINVINGRWCKN